MQNLVQETCNVAKEALLQHFNNTLREFAQQLADSNFCGTEQKFVRTRVRQLFVGLTLNKTLCINQFVQILHAQNQDLLALIATPVESISHDTVSKVLRSIELFQGLRIPEIYAAVGVEDKKHLWAYVSRLFHLAKLYIGASGPVNPGGDAVKFMESTAQTLLQDENMQKELLEFGAPAIETLLKAPQVRNTFERYSQQGVTAETLPALVTDLLKNAGDEGVQKVFQESFQQLQQHPEKCRELSERLFQALPQANTANQQDVSVLLDLFKNSMNIK